MTNETWIQQKARLIDRFGERNFSKEFSLLVAIECKPMPDYAFVDMVNAIIGGRRPNDPPLIADFRNARLAFEKRRFEKELSGAQRAMDQKLTRPVLEILKPYVGNVRSINEAVEVRRLQIMREKEINPSYDPMKDPKWMGGDDIA